MYFNARSILPKIDELRALCVNHKPNIVCIVESWLDDTIDNNELCIENYVSVRVDRNRHGDGVLIWNHCLLMLFSLGRLTLSLLFYLSLFHHHHHLNFVLVSVRADRNRHGDGVLIYIMVF